MCQSLSHLTFGHRMEPNTARSPERRQEETFPTQEYVGQPLNHLDVERNGAFEHGNMSRLDAHHLIGLKMVFDRITIQFGECHTGTSQFLQDKTFACKHANAKPPREENIKFHTLLRT